MEGTEKDLVTAKRDVLFEKPALECRASDAANLNRRLFLNRLDSIIQLALNFSDFPNIIRNRSKSSEDSFG